MSGLLCGTLASTAAGAQLVATGSDQVRVTLTEAAFLPRTSVGSIQTSIATSMNGETGPWHATLRFTKRDASTGVVQYELEVRNASETPLSLPVGADGATIWSACKDAPISEVNIDLRNAGRVAPLASLPAVHSCAALQASAATVLPGHSVIFSGSLMNSSLASERADVSAVVSVCSATYSLEGSDPHTTRTCQLPVTSNRAVLASTPSGSAATASSRRLDRRANP